MWTLSNAAHRVPESVIARAPGLLVPVVREGRAERGWPYAVAMAREIPDEAEVSQAVLRLDTTVAHPARVYDYFLGGKDNFAADRDAAEAAAAAFPQIAESARAARAFLRRVVGFLAEEAGIRQFLDVGTGLPSGENVHQVAQSID